MEMLKGLTGRSAAAGTGSGASKPTSISDFGKAPSPPQPPPPFYKMRIITVSSNDFLYSYCDDLKKNDTHTA